ncbi:hypothetical protein [Deinococcus multiflagellatus]|uniref:Uncharacterized protein n=2 Tax=Deinococcus multiflagellatus TaxID=1656887 RepID=A0ABW1ZGN0_9DEIO
MLVFAVYFGLGALPESIKDLPLGRAVRYALLVATAAWVVPTLLRRWMPAQVAATAPAAQPVH